MRKFLAGSLIIYLLFAGLISARAQDQNTVRISLYSLRTGSFPTITVGLDVFGSAGNVVSGEVISVDSFRNVVVGQKRPIALVGVSDLVVVDAGDVILVCRRDRAQDVRKVTEALHARGDEDLL